MDAELLAGLRAAAAKEKANVEIVAPVVGGVDTSDGNHIAADQKLEGAPSVLYDAVALLTTKEGAAQLANLPAARDFVSDAYAHCKFIAYVGEANALFAATGLDTHLDDGFVRIGNGQRPATDFLTRCRQLRSWGRQATIS
ncbi:hypothetical protein ACFQ1L_17560 [Phytohabitans flavus]|uniref:hypothetical protein n=1 Tax=Phytohabitans flavus TaxID=1076124 RepID=UPI00363B0DD9